ncbi:hypothetical protein ACH9D2_10915 [Kocuria sp. M4R2S49]|uniref:hypothetical protein n=1 Tax=Kocuria rhizosphaericola TaxID=3376284 RepID=UPI003789FD4D
MGTNCGVRDAPVPRLFSQHVTDTGCPVEEGGRLVGLRARSGQHHLDRRPHRDGLGP